MFAHRTIHLLNFSSVCDLEESRLMTATRWVSNLRNERHTTCIVPECTHLFYCLVDFTQWALKGVKRVD